MAKRRILCVFCGCRIEGEKVAQSRGWRHPECEKPARGYLPAAPLTPAERGERREDNREIRRHSGKRK